MARKDLVKHKLTPAQEDKILWILESFGGWADSQLLAEALDCTPKAIQNFTQSNRAKQALSHFSSRSSPRQHAAQFLEDTASHSAYGEAVIDEDDVLASGLTIHEPLTPEEISLVNEHKEARKKARLSRRTR